MREVERSGYNRRFLCLCACGKETVKFLNNLQAGRSTSCGCTYAQGVTGRAVVLAQRRAASEESDEGRICHTCQEWKPWERFSRDLRRTRQKSSNCIDCGHWRLVKSQYGLTREEWERMESDQSGTCALCGEPEVTRLAVDHDHSCCPAGRACKSCIRGMLCAVCNRMLGHVETKAALAVRFADYLSRRPLLDLTTSAAPTVLEDVTD